MTGAARPQKKRRRRAEQPILNRGFWTKLLTTLAVAAAVLLLFTIFFKIRDIQVTGNAYHSREEILAAAGVEEGDNLLTHNKAVTAARIKSECHYISEVRITRRLPDTLCISVTEFDVTYAVRADDGGYWLMTAAGKLLEQTDETEAKQHVTVEGFTVASPKAGAEFTIGTTTEKDTLAAADQKTAVTRVLTLLESSELAEKIKTVTVTSSYDISLQYEDCYRIVLGNMENLDYKLACVDVVLAKLESYQTGTIDVSGAMENKLYFKDDNEN